MRTFGLGGDSEVRLEDGGLALGPRRLVPLALAAHAHGGAVIEALERQALSRNPGRFDGRLVLRTGVPDRLAAGLTPVEERLYATVTREPRPLDRVLSSTVQAVALDRLVARGLVHIGGFTPSDAAHTLGLQDNWNAEAARLGATLFSRRRDRLGNPVAADAEALSRRVLAALTRRSAEAILETALAEDGHDGARTVAHALVQRALDGAGNGGGGIARLSLALDRPVIGLGASAPLHYAALPPLLGNACVVPDDTDVANALGAVVGQVRVSAEAQVSQPQPGLFRISSGEGIADFGEEEEALAAAEAAARRMAAARGAQAGADEAQITVSRDIRAATVEGERAFVEAIVTATASGRPRIAR